MDKDAICREMEEEFLSTFMGELIPGVLHNFANPLNGIMGRAKLLQRRLDDSIKKMEARFPGFNQDFGSEKIIRDINSISAESERFFKLFGDLSDKMMLLSSTDLEKINLSYLIESEMRFADFYLDFKHELKKNICLDFELPAIVGGAADISLAFTNILISAKERMKYSPVKEFAISTQHDAGNVFVMIQDSGEAISESCRQLTEVQLDDCKLANLSKCERGLGGALLLLRHYGASLSIRSTEGSNQLSLRFPLAAAG